MTPREYAEIFRNNAMAEGVIVGDLIPVAMLNGVEEAWEFTITPEDELPISVLVRGYTAEVDLTASAIPQITPEEEGHVG